MAEDQLELAQAADAASLTVEEAETMLAELGRELVHAGAFDGLD